MTTVLFLVIVTVVSVRLIYLVFFANIAPPFPSPIPEGGGVGPVSCDLGGWAHNPYPDHYGLLEWTAIYLRSCIL